MTTSLILISLLVGYLLGTLPTAYWAVKLFTGKDIRASGSGNVGAMNSFAVTGSKWAGILVFVVDALKGFAAVLAVRLIAPDDDFRIWYEWIAVLGAILGHNFNLWLSISSRKLVGGKGLATACGGLAIIWPITIAFWGVLFVVGFFGYKLWRGRSTIIPGNVLATLLVAIPTYFVYGTVGLIGVGAFALAILPKHWDQMRDLLSPAAERIPTR
ncbi:MAG TPA: glycerol-3-phosphate acyltransferase [Rhodothermales bacterium]